MTPRMTELDWQHNRALEEYHDRIHACERFHESIAIVWASPIPEVYSASILGFGKRAGLL